MTTEADRVPADAKNVDPKNVDDKNVDEMTVEEPIVLTDTRDLFSGLDAGFLHRNWSVIDVYGRLARIQSVRAEVEERLRGASSAGSAA